MKKKIMKCLDSLGFTLISDDTSTRKIFVYENILVSIEENPPLKNK